MSNDKAKPLREVSKHDIWRLMSEEDKQNVNDLINTFWSAEDRKTAPLDIRVGNCVYHKPDLSPPPGTEERSMEKEWLYWHRPFKSRRKKTGQGPSQKADKAA